MARSLGVGGSRSTANTAAADEPNTERTPLLAGTPSPTTTSTPGTPAALSDGSITPPTLAPVNSDLRALLRPRVLVLCFIIVFLIELGVGMAIPPINAFMEGVLCRQMHPDAVALPRGEGGDNVCKSDDVQAYLAMLRGWQYTFDCVPSIVGAVPYGMLSDRWGRRPVVGLSMVGLVMSQVFIYVVFYFSDTVPLWVTWFSSAFQLIGGGSAILVAMLYTIPADVVPAAERAIVFMQLAAVFLASQMIAGPIGGVMLIWGPWLPFFVSLTVLIIATLAILAVPETVHIHNRKGAENGQDEHDDRGHGPMELWRKAISSLAELWEFVFSNKRLTFLMLSLMFVVLGRFVAEFLLQYASKRYDWSWMVASFVLAIPNAGSLVTLLVLLPVISWFCTQRLGMASVEKDLWLARWSGAAMIVGNLILAVSPNGAFFSFGLLWFAVGSGLSSLVRSLLNALVEEHHVGIVNSLFGFMEMIGLTTAGPLLAKSFEVGLDRKGVWVGLPCFVAALLFTVSSSILWAFRLPNRRMTTVEPS